MALAEKMLAAEFGQKVVSHHTYVLGFRRRPDGGRRRRRRSALAGHWKLNKLIVLV